MDTSKLSIAICQINAKVGDIDSNKNKIIDIISDPNLEKVSLFVFPELFLSGYIPLDDLYRSDFVDRIDQAIKFILENSNGKNLIFGAPRKIAGNNRDNLFYNSAYVISEDKIIRIVDKVLLPNYDVFHEKRYFIPGDKIEPLNLLNFSIGLQICEDMWDLRLDHHVNVTKQLIDSGAQLIINISASPYQLGKLEDRIDVATTHVVDNQVPLLYCNSVGGQDEITFDGRSFLIQRNGEVRRVSDAFKESIEIVTFDSDQEIFHLSKKSRENKIHSDDNEEIVNAICYNLQEYILKNKLNKKILIALSGGIDSALTAALACLAIGTNNVKGIYLPTQFSSDQSLNDVKQLSTNLGIELDIFSIDDYFNLLSEQLKNSYNIPEELNLADENLQARIRGIILMYLSNYYDNLVLSTGNKSEIAVGYTTLYGDTVGGKNLIGDLYKTQVYELANYLKKININIPDSIISREPTAELRHDQKDSDSLPEYDILDKILFQLIEEEKSPQLIIESGYEDQMVHKIYNLVKRAEFKRAQLVQTVKINHRTFGIGRLVPVTKN